jgi:hypothetical protein
MIELTNATMKIPRGIGRSAATVSIILSSLLFAGPGTAGTTSAVPMAQIQPLQQQRLAPAQQQLQQNQLQMQLPQQRLNLQQQGQQNLQQEQQHLQQQQQHQLQQPQSEPKLKP